MSQRITRVRCCDCTAMSMSTGRCQSPAGTLAGQQHISTPARPIRCPAFDSWRQAVRASTGPRHTTGSQQSIL